MQNKPHSPIVYAIAMTIGMILIVKAWVESYIDTTWSSLGSGKWYFWIAWTISTVVGYEIGHWLWEKIPMQPLMILLKIMIIIMLIIISMWIAVRHVKFAQSHETEQIMAFGDIQTHILLYVSFIVCSSTAITMLAIGAFDLARWIFR